ELDRARVLELEVRSRAAQGDYSGAIDVTCRALRLVGVRLSPRPLPPALALAFARYRWARGRRPLEALANAPAVTDSTPTIALRLLAGLGPIAITVRPLLLPVIALQLMELSWRAGASPEAAAGQAMWAMLVASVGDVDDGLRNVELARRLSDRFEGASAP